MKEKLEKLGACNEAIKWASTQPDYKTAWQNCERGDWMLWLAKALNVDDRKLTLAKYHCVNQVRHLMVDQRSIDAMEAALKYANSEISRDELNNYAEAAVAAADAADYAATDAAATAAATDAADADAAAAAHAAAYAAYAAAAYAAYAAAAAAAAYAAAAAAAYAAAAAAAYAADAADAAAAARKENQLQTANICREFLTDAVMAAIGKLPITEEYGRGKTNGK